MYNSLFLTAVSWEPDLCRKLAEEGVENFHFYTLNRAGLALSTCRLLGLKPHPAKAA